MVIDHVLKLITIDEMDEYMQWSKINDLHAYKVLVFSIFFFFLSRNKQIDVYLPMQENTSSMGFSRPTCCCLFNYLILEVIFCSSVWIEKLLWSEKTRKREVGI